MGNSYAGCLAYADDLSLLSPTKKGLHKLVDLCEEYAKENDILFNGNKSQFLILKEEVILLKFAMLKVHRSQKQLKFAFILVLGNLSHSFRFLHYFFFILTK